MKIYPPYDKIASRASEWHLTDADARALGRATWVLTEKVHGANMGWWSDGQELRIAKRKAWLPPEVDFFGHTRLIPDLAPRLHALHARLGAPAVLVYGEIFGGGYPHPDVSVVPDVQPVQTGVWYCPQIAFLGFDVALIDGDTRTWLPYDEARAALEAVGIMTATELARGSQAQCSAHRVRFPTTIPARFGLPEIAENVAEGAVLRPIETILIETKRGRMRPVLKHKIPEFSEDRRFHEATDWSLSSWTLDTFEAAILDRLTPARIAAARSKVGPQAPFEELQDEVTQDILSDLTHETPWAGLAPDERTLLTEVLVTAVEELLE